MVLRVLRIEDGAVGESYALKNWKGGGTPPSIFTVMTMIQTRSRPKIEVKSAFSVINAIAYKPALEAAFEGC
jgi:hypothetical protein